MFRQINMYVVNFQWGKIVAVTFIDSLERMKAMVRDLHPLIGE
jgi:hypothetical protein